MYSCRFGVLLERDEPRSPTLGSGSFLVGFLFEIIVVFR